jgi:CheY-like chemotaxis protein
VAIVGESLADGPGETLGRQVREDPALAGLRLVLASARPERGDAARFQQAGFDAYLSTPLRQGELVACLARLQTAQAAAEPAPLVTRHTLAEAAARARGRVLLAEDNVVNQRVAVKMLGRLGLRCDVAADGREAVQAVQARRYDLVLMDCQMPNLDGYQATRRIRELEAGTRHTPIVALTAGARDSDRADCRAAGMDDYLSKPFTAEQIQAMVERYLPAG